MQAFQIEIGSCDYNKHNRESMDKSQYYAFAGKMDYKAGISRLYFSFFLILRRKIPCFPEMRRRKEKREHSENLQNLYKRGLLSIYKLHFVENGG